MKHLIGFTLCLASCMTPVDPNLDDVSGVYVGGGKFIDSQFHRTVQNYSVRVVYFAHDKYANGTITFKRLPDTSFSTHFQFSVGPDSSGTRVHQMQGRAFCMDQHSAPEIAAGYDELYPCKLSYDSVYGVINAGITMDLGGVRGSCEVIWARREK